MTQPSVDNVQGLLALVTRQGHSIGGPITGTPEGIQHQLRSSLANHGGKAQHCYAMLQVEDSVDARVCAYYFDPEGQAITREDYYVLIDRDLPRPCTPAFQAAAAYGMAAQFVLTNPEAAQKHYERRLARWREQNALVKAERDLAYGRAPRG